MSQIDLKKMTKEMLEKKIKSKIDEFYTDKKKEKQKEVKKESKIVNNDDYEEEDELELEPIHDNIKNTFVQKQEGDEVNYFYLNIVGISIGIALIILFFIIRYFCCCK